MSKEFKKSLIKLTLGLSLVILSSITIGILIEKIKRLDGIIEPYNYDINEDGIVDLYDLECLEKYLMSE